MPPLAKAAEIAEDQPKFPTSQPSANRMKEMAAEAG